MMVTRMPHNPVPRPYRKELTIVAARIRYSPSPTAWRRTRRLKLQRPKQHRVHDAENRCVCADAQRERENRHSRESGILPQHSQPESQILKKRFQPLRKSARLAHLLGIFLHSAKLHPRTPLRFLARNPVVLKFRGARRKMRLQLVVHAGIEFAFAK